MTKPRRRQAGEGTISPYETKAGTLYLAKWQEPQVDGTVKARLKRGFATRKAAAVHLTDVRASLRDGSYVAPHKTTVAAHMGAWLDGLRKQPSTVESYRRNVRLHVLPYIGELRLEQLTGTRLTALYRQLEASGRVGGTGEDKGLSARTVRYIHTIVHAALDAAVRDRLLAVNPADAATPPSAKEAAPPEMHYWSAVELRAFLADREERGDDLLMAWKLLAATGMRRGELLGLRWGDVDFTTGRVSVRRSASLIKTEGNGDRIDVGPTKTGKARVVDLDAQTLSDLRVYRKERGALFLSLVRDEAYVVSDVDGNVRHPYRFSRRFTDAVAQTRRTLGEDKLKAIRLHDLRHTHATILLAAGVPVKVVSERLGHASPTITLGVYAHVMPGMQKEAAEQFGALMYGGI
ncbi:site-specific integrase [Sinomonas cyclohexanicum]|uniref:Site-specific integrase n=1 Tax=Sinomonas cyclohexanicum TaxID=322009 RepID=A0ABN6FH87_SINCY|nr:site-specific integrase [Corynebacterium cyclohexanicum]BCT76083.1 site-specific integrase [Corynebacterium cyclohexanicum]